VCADTVLLESPPAPPPVDVSETPVPVMEESSPLVAEAPPPPTSNVYTAPPVKVARLSVLVPPPEFSEAYLSLYPPAPAPPQVF
jgi:hypothetical protein